MLISPHAGRYTESKALSHSNLKSALESSNLKSPNANRPGDLTPAQHARIRRQLALIPVYIWIVFSWNHLLVQLPPVAPARDFVHFYVQAVIAREHNAPALYDMAAMAAMVPRLVPGLGETLYPPVYGPQISVLFSPLARLSYVAARNLWLAITLIVYALCCYAVWRVCPRLRDRRGLTMLLLAAAPALHFLLGFIQISVIGLVCVTVGFFALRANRPFIAGVALGTLAYKPPLGLAIAFVLVFAREWRIVVAAVCAAAAQVAVGVLYWGPSILPAYVGALLRVPGVAFDMEPNRFHMHSWRAFFDILGLPPALSFAAYGIVAAATSLVALWCWRAHGPLALRYTALIVATLLVDPHLYAYDLVLLIPGLMLLWDWVLAQPERTVTDLWPLASDRWPLARTSFNTLFVVLLYVCYLSPLFATAADLAHVQMSVPLHSLLLISIASVLSLQSPFHSF